MRKADYILEKLENFETLVSKAAEPTFTMPKEVYRTKTPIVHTPAISEHKLNLPESGIMSPESHKMPTETSHTVEPSKSKLKIIKDPKGKFILDRNSVPKEWWDEKGNIKPEHQQAFNEAKMQAGFKEGFDKAKAERLDAKKQAKINKTLNAIDFSINAGAKAYSMLYPDSVWKTVKSAFKVIAFTTIISWIWSGGKKITSKDKAKQQTIDGSVNEVANIQTTVPISGPELKTRVTNLSNKLSELKAKTPAGQTMINKSVSGLNAFASNLSTLANVPNIENHNEVQSYATKSNTTLLDGLELSTDLDELADVLERSKRLELSKLTKETSDAIKDHIAVIDSAKAGALQGEI